MRSKVAVDEEKEASIVVSNEKVKHGGLQEENVRDEEKLNADQSETEGEAEALREVPKKKLRRVRANETLKTLKILSNAHDSSLLSPWQEEIEMHRDSDSCVLDDDDEKEVEWRPAPAERYIKSYRQFLAKEGRRAWRGSNHYKKEGQKPAYWSPRLFEHFAWFGLGVTKRSSCTEPFIEWGDFIEVFGPEFDGTGPLQHGRGKGKRKRKGEGEKMDAGAADTADPDHVCTCRAQAPSPSRPQVLVPKPAAIDATQSKYEARYRAFRDTLPGIIALGAEQIMMDRY